MKAPIIDENRYDPYDVIVTGGGMAGIAAALLAAFLKDGQPRGVDVERLQSILRKSGALLAARPDPL
jgi:anaerobic glycerol-3-phosphate dehydrogenase